MMHCRRPPQRQRQLGAAILVALLLLAVVATLATSMVWLQHRAVQVETAERARAQIVWILHGAIDWARLILRTDATAETTNLAQAWATPLEEARLSTFLAADGNTGPDGGLDAFLGGSITDAQSRYNLRNLTEADPTLAAQEVAILRRLCQWAGCGDDVAEGIAQGLRQAAAGTEAGAPLAPQRLDDLTWLGVSPADIERLRPWVSLLPAGGKPINVNTAPREVLAAVIETIDLGGADRLIQARRNGPFKTVDALREHLPAGIELPLARLAVKSEFFEVRGRMRLDDRVIEELALLERQGREVRTRQRTRIQRVLDPQALR